MAHRKSRNLPARVSPVSLGELDEGTIASLGPGADLERVRFGGVDLSGKRLDGASLWECEMTDVVADKVSLQGAVITEASITNWDSAVLSAARVGLRDSTLQRSRIGSAEMYQSSWSSVFVSECKLGFINLSGSTLNNVVFEKCRIEELDLSGAKVSRFAFRDCEVQSINIDKASFATADFTGVQLSQVQGLPYLRGVVMSSSQIREYAPLFASNLGIVVEN